MTAFQAFGWRWFGDFDEIHSSIYVLAGAGYCGFLTMDMQDVGFPNVLPEITPWMKYGADGEVVSIRNRWFNDHPMIWPLVVPYALPIVVHLFKFYKMTTPVNDLPRFARL